MALAPPSTSRLSRRRLLAFSALSLGMAASATLTLSAQGQARSLFLSAAADAEDKHWLRAFSLREGRLEQRFAHSLPGRAHHIAVDPQQGLFVVIARRPGRWLMTGDLSSGEILSTTRVPDGRHLFGHGVFSPDGRWFYSVESDYEAEADNGCIGVWSVNALRAAPLHRESEFSTHGTGPHELAFMPDGQSLVVANGGIRTHPDSGREKLNLEHMRPSLVYLDTQEGRLLERVAMEDQYHQNSIRHLDVNQNGQVALAMQYQGAPFAEAPLVALHQRGQPLQIPEVPLEVQQRMQQYCGSVRFDHSGRYLAVSCPRGNMMTVWDAAGSRFIQALRSRDGCGVCAWENGFLYTAGSGDVSFFAPGTSAPRDYSQTLDGQVLWDNHLSMV